MGKNINRLLFIMLAGIFITGCSASKSSESAPMEKAYEGEMVDESAVEEEVGFDGESPQRKTNQKLIYRASMDVEVTEKLDPLIKSIQSFVEGHDGYIENMEQYRRGYDPVTQEELEGIFMTIRIPHEHYNKALQTIGDLGAVINKTSSVEDVTLQYSDIESTLKMYKVEQDRLLEMLENETTDVKDMIEIEKRLSEVRVELEKQESARRALESQISYDTIELQMNQVRRSSELTASKSFGSRIKSAFIKSVDGVIIFFQNAVLAATYLLIPLIILGVILGLVSIPVSKVIKRRKDKSESKQDNNAD